MCHPPATYCNHDPTVGAPVQGENCLNRVALRQRADGCVPMRGSLGDWHGASLAETLLSRLDRELRAAPVGPLARAQQKGILVKEMSFENKMWIVLIIAWRDMSKTPHHSPRCQIRLVLKVKAYYCRKQACLRKLGLDFYPAGN